MTEIKAVIFDLYDTLVYIPNRTDPYHNLFKELNITPLEMKKARRIALTEDFGNISELVEKIKPNAGIDIKLYEDDIAKENKSVVAFPETNAVLGKLQKRGFKIGLISNLSSSYKKPFFDLKLENYFDKIFFSCKVGLKKPDIKIYQKMIQELSIEPSQALMVGDSLYCDVYPPRLIGMNAVLIDRENKSDATPKIVSLEEIFQYC